MRGIFQREIAERHGVFDVNVRKNRRVRTNSLPIAQRAEGVALDQSTGRR